MYLQGGKDGMSLARYAYYNGTLLDSFLCIFDLKYATLWGATGDNVSTIMESMLAGRVVQHTM